MEQTRIAELLASYIKRPLTDAQLHQLAAYLDLLLKWNARMNLTAVRDPAQILTRHFGESLFAAEQLLPSEEVTSTIDLGSGAGFPGVPLAIYAPGVHVALIESQQKKATFLKELARTLALHNIAVFHGRGEDFANTAQLVTMRAVERFADALPVAARLVADGGRLALLIGADQSPAAVELIPGFHWSDPVAVPGSERRVLMVGRKPA